MKVYFKYGFSAYSGTVDQMVYQSWYDHRLCLGRRFTYPELTLNNAHIGSVGKNLTAVYQSANADYIEDLKKYVKRNRQENKPHDVDLWHPMPGPLALFNELMWAWYDSDPTHVDLTTVTVADIVTADADVRTIARAVGADFLPSVKVYSDLTSDIQ